MESITEEEELIQMVIDFIESEPTTQQKKLSEQPNPITTNHEPTYFDTLQEIIGGPTESEVEVLEKITMYVRNIGSLREPMNSLNKWVVVRLNKDGYEASLCQTSLVSFHGLATGDYEFVDVMIKGDQNISTRLIVDMDFRSQFELARPTPSYTKLVGILPSVFVGTEEKLKNVVSLLCSAAKQSLKESGLHIPPWRRASYMVSKWLSESCKKVSL